MWNFNYKQSLRIHKENDGDTGEYVPQTYTRIFIIPLKYITLIMMELTLYLLRDPLRRLWNRTNVLHARPVITRAKYVPAVKFLVTRYA